MNINFDLAGLIVVTWDYQQSHFPEYSSLEFQTLRTGTWEMWKSEMKPPSLQKILAVRCGRLSELHSSSHVTVTTDHTFF